MSAPDPKAWEIAEADWDEMVNEYGYWCEPLPRIIYSIARRRAIAELKALASESFEMQGYDKFWQAIDAAQIQDRIAAIEAEES